jgi:hypothetical protein
MVAEEEHNCGEGDDADHNPEALAKGLVGLDSIDHGHADRREEPAEREQVRIGLRKGDANDKVGGDEEGGEERRVGE